MSAASTAQGAGGGRPRKGDRVAVIGAGVSGLVAAYLLRRDYQVTLYEKDSRLGGHSHTVDVHLAGRDYQVDTGFIVFNDRTYPAFIKLLEELQVESIEAPMTFGVRSENSGVEYAVTSIDSLFAQRRNALSPGFWRLLADIVRWNRLATRSQGAAFQRIRLEDFLRGKGFSERFVSEYLYPLGSAIWSCPAERFGDFPVGFLTAFFHNHGMLAWAGHPQWRTVKGGSRTYVEAIERALSGSIETGSAVSSVARHEDRVDLKRGDGGVDSYDHVVIACHADDALALLEDPAELETDILNTFEYRSNQVVLHTEAREMPVRRKAWAAWSYYVGRHKSGVSLSYWMNALQHLDCPIDVFVTVNPNLEIADEQRMGEFEYRHPLYTVDTSAAQARHRELIDHRRTSYCGAYWGFGFHEDGVRSAMSVGDAFGVAL